MRLRARNLKACGGGQAPTAPPRRKPKRVGSGDGEDDSSDGEDDSSDDTARGEWFTIRCLLGKRKMTTNLSRADGGDP